MKAYEEQMANFFEEMNSTPKHNGPRLSPSTSSKPEESSKKQTEDVVVDENGIKVSDLVDEGGDVREAGKKLPFSKSSALWTSVESMEVFQKIPQNPHFKDLENCREICREGLAIGYMAIFANLVDKAAKLQLDDPKSIMDDILVTLSDLERHGFDVRTVKDRISCLLELKCEYERLVDEAKEVTSQMVKHNKDPTRMEEEILEIDKQIEELQSKRSVAISAKENAREMMSVLAARVKECEAKIQCEGTQFVFWLLL